MIAFVKISLQDGISKKILSQASALSKKAGTCILLCLDAESKFQKIVYHNGEMVSHVLGNSININFASFGRVDPFIEDVEREIGDSLEGLYIRHMVPSRVYLKFLKKYHNNGIVYEIPTYPYYYEQITASNNKVLTLIRLVHESIHWPGIYKNVKKIVAIPCRSTARKFKKMQYITNGYSSAGKFIPKGSTSMGSDTALTLIGVGTIQRYHGYEKIIELMHSQKEHNIKFIIVGGGEVDYLKALVEKYELDDKVVFTGPKGGDELEKLYRSADIGVGTMALELRKADIDTGIKILDYYIHGLPVISSGKCPWSENSGERPYLIMNDSTGIKDIIDLNIKFNNEKREKLSQLSNEEYAWNSIMGRVIND